MKKFMLLAICGIFMVSVSSCNNEVYTAENVDDELVDDNTKVFLQSLDSLNSTYPKPAETRGWGIRILTAAVDGSMGVVGGAMGPWGAFIVGTAASWAYEDYVNYILRKANGYEISSDNPSISEEPNVCVAFLDENSTLEDSLGYIHNLVLRDLKLSNIKFIDDNGNIDYDLLLKKCNLYLKKYNVNCDEFVNNRVTKNNIIETTKASVESFFEYGQGEITLDDCYARIEKDVKSRYNRSFDISELKAVEKRLLIMSDMTRDDIYTYASQLNGIIKKADLPVEKKAMIKSACDVTVNSRVYWNAKHSIE